MRVGRKGLGPGRATGQIYLTPEAMDALDEDPSNHLPGSSITYRKAVEPQQGRKVFAVQTFATPFCLNSPAA
jgi:hypothetical protein